MRRPGRDTRSENRRAPAIIIPPAWQIPEREATPDSVYWGRRAFLKALGIGGLGAGLWIAGCGRAGSTGAPTIGSPPKDVTGRYPAPRNEAYSLDRPLTDESVAGRYNNFYEFTSDKELVIGLSREFKMRPWSLEVTGLVARPAVYDVDDLVRKMPLDERLYRHRCVEAWAMAVPWTGFPLSALIRKAEPRPEARYVRFVSFSEPEQPGMKKMNYVPWPYHEGLTLPEAMNELTILATGIYGHPLPPQHGGPVRLVVPWKYGFKSIKSIVRIELTRAQPATLWNTLEPREYDFVANVNPAIPHPRWSQASERMLGTEKRRPTIIYNGYGRYVGALYKG